MYKALLLSQEHDSRSFLSVVRSLGEKKISIHIVYNGKDTPALHSKYIAKKILLPELLKRKLWLKETITLLEKEQYTLVIPCDDLSIQALENNKAELSKHANLYLLNSYAYDTVNNKHNTTQLASTLKIPVPKNILVEKSYNLDEITEYFGFPLVIKPVSSFDAHSTKKHEVIIVHKIDKLKSTLDSMLECSPVQIQSYFSGIGVAINIIAKNGEIIATAQHKRLHEPFTGGGSSYRKSTLVDKGMLDASQKIVSKLNYTGVAMFEFKYNTTTKQWVLLEINGRFWGSLPLSISAGINFPYLLFLILLDKKIETNKIKYKENIYQRNLTSDLMWMKDAFLNENKSKLAAQGYSKYSLLWESFRVLSFRDNFDSFTFSDPTPFFIEIYKIYRQIIYKINKKIRNKLFSNKFIRRQVKKILISKLSKANNILFICKGNICRSPFAHKAASELWPTISAINSSGHYKKDNRSAPDLAIKCASSLNIELSSHRSSTIDLEAIENADLIFYFDEENRTKLIKRFPLYKKKMYPLNFLSENLPVEIEDPIDKDESEFLKTYEDIYDLIKNTAI